MTDHQFIDPLKKQQKKPPVDGSAGPSHEQPMARLQGVVGNRGIQRLLAERGGDIKRSAFIQTKLTVGAADDSYEKEADQVAHDVMTMRDPSIQRAEEDELAAKRIDGVQRAEEDELAAKRITTIQRAEEDELAAKRVDSIQRAEEDELAAKRVDSIQRAEEDELAAKRIGGIQRAEEDELAAKRIDGIQRAEEDELAAKRIDGIQRAEEDELAAKRIDGIQRAEEDELAAKRIDGIQRAEEDELAAKRVDMMDSFQVGDDVENKINASKGSGQGLPDTAREFFEPRFGQDFGDVRIHSGGESDNLNRSISARAFTSGNDIYFRNGEFNPDNNAGRELLAHELTHVVQQTGGKAQAKRADDSQ